jgi:hypothetical protein
MAKDFPTQELLIELETALHRLVESFWEAPYQHFTEADAVAGLQAWVARRPGLASVHRTADGFETGLLHREYPTFFRLDDQNPTARQGPPYGRGHYDLALLDPAFVRLHAAERVYNRTLAERPEQPHPPLLAAVEFKLFPLGWKAQQDSVVRQELGKLRLALQAPADVRAAYLCALCRDPAPERAHPEATQAAVAALLAGFPEVGAVAAVCWPHAEQDAFVHYAGPWITAAEGAL